MDDHFEALPFWLSLGKRGWTCVHIDAHLDVQDLGLPADLITRFAQGVDIQELRGTRSLPWGGLHCGNFLFPALVSGLIRHLVWVVPRFLVPEDISLLGWCREELTRWIDPTLAELHSLELIASERVQGQLCQQKLTVCYSDHVPHFDGPIALDIDVDYFVRTSDDQVWQSPLALFQQLEHLDIEALTIATSIEGGYTPPTLHNLGQQCLEVLGLTGTEFPVHYDFQPSDAVWRAIHQERFAVAQELLSHCGQEPARWFLESLVAANQKDGPQAEKCLRQLLRDVPMTAAEEAQVYLMLADSLDRSRHREASKLLQKALQMAPERYDIRFNLAKRLKDAGLYSEAARTLRRVLQQSGDRFSGLEHLLELARTYTQMGQGALAQATHRQLQAKDTFGLYAMHSLLDQART